LGLGNGTGQGAVVRTDAGATAAAAAAALADARAQAGRPATRLALAEVALAACPWSPALAALVCGAAYDAAAATGYTAVVTGTSASASSASSSLSSSAPLPSQQLQHVPMACVQELLCSLLHAFFVIEKAARSALSSSQGINEHRRGFSCAGTVALVSVLRALAASGYPEVASHVAAAFVAETDPSVSGRGHHRSYMPTAAYKALKASLEAVPGAASLGHAVLENLFRVLRSAAQRAPPPLPQEQGEAGGAPPPPFFLDARALGLVGLCGAWLLASGSLPPSAVAFADDPSDWELLGLAW
jgi:hypothetical protein